MLLLNVTGLGTDRADKIRDAVDQLIESDHHSMVVVRTIGAGVLYDLRDVLQQRVARAKYKFPVEDLRCATVDDFEVPLLKETQWLNNGGIIIVDEADQLDVKPKLAEWLRSKESPYQKLIYIMNAPKEPGQLEAALIAFGEKHS